MAIENDIAKVLLRRWYIVLLGLIGTVALCIGAIQTTPVSYQSSARFSVLPPYAKGANPYLNLNDLAPLTDLLATTATSDSAVEALRSQGITEDYVVTRDLGASGAVVLVVGTGDTARRALQVTKAVGATLPAILERIQRQANVSSANSATLKPVATDSKATEISKQRKRKVIFAAGIGIVLTGLIAIGLDRLLVARRRRKIRPRQQQAEFDDLRADDADDAHLEPHFSDDQLDTIWPIAD